MPMSEFLPRKEHEEFAKRMEEEHARQNKRITTLEDTVKQFTSLTISIEKMAINMENMLKEQKKQGERLDKIEIAPAEDFKQIKRTVATAIISTVVTAVVAACIVAIKSYL